MWRTRSRWSGVADEPPAPAAMPSSTCAGVFAMTRTTGWPCGRPASRVAVSTPAASETTRASGPSAGAISASRPRMSCGLTPRTTVAAPATASRFEVISMPYADRNSSTRSGRRSVATRSPGCQPARTSPDSTVSPMTPAPSSASRLRRWGCPSSSAWLVMPRSDPAPGEEVAGDEFRDLDRVQCRALAQVVVADEHHQALALRRRAVRTDPADVARVAPGRVQRGGDVHELDAGSLGEHSRRLLRAQVVAELGVHGQRVAGEDGDADAGACNPQIGDVQDLARLVAELLLLVGLQPAVVDDRAGHRQHVVGDRLHVELRVRQGHRPAVERGPGGLLGHRADLPVELGHAGATGAGDGLVRRDLQPDQPGRAVQ